MRTSTGIQRPGRGTGRAHRPRVPQNTARSDSGYDKRAMFSFLERELPAVGRVFSARHIFGADRVPRSVVRNGSGTPEVGQLDG